VIRAAAVLALVVSAALPRGAMAQSLSAFYDASPSELAGPPGSVIRTEDMLGAPWYSRSARILYRSTGLDGQPIAVSAVIVVPTTPAPPDGRRIVAWAHPTTGIAQKCAPSLGFEGALETIMGLRELLDRGYVVVATDYPGLGTAGEHPYLVGISEGRAVLDSVRAARVLGQGAAEFAVWGHSQGGHAAIWAAEIGAYAPELKLVGAALAAPASELAELMHKDDGDAVGKVLSAFTLTSWSRVFKAPLAAVAEPNAISPVEAIGGECLSGLSDLVIDADALLHLPQGFLKADPSTTPPWSGYVSANTPALKASKWPPIFIAQGTDDVVVEASVTTQFAVRLCNQGARLRYFNGPDATHETIAEVSATAAAGWIADRFAGLPPPTDCIDKSSGGPR
jgi:acetyl esterase/lipase